MTSTLRYGRVDAVMVVVHGTRDPSVEDWSTYVDAYAEGVSEYGVRGLLVITDGGGPNAAQRREVLTRIEQFLVLKGLSIKEVRTAICTSSAVARGITTAIAWMTSGAFRSFAYAERREALDYLGAPAKTQVEVQELVKRLSAELAASR